MVVKQWTRIALFVLAFSCPPHVHAQPATARTVADVFASWRQNAEKVKSARIKFSHRVREIDQFSRFQSEWVPREGFDESSVENYHFSIDGDKVCCESLQWTYDEHVQGRTLYFFGELPFPKELSAGVTARRFDRALYSGFRDEELGVRNPQRFKAVCDGQSRRNIWEANETQYARGVVVRPTSTGGIDWISFNALFQGEFDLDSLVYQPLLLAYRPFHPCYAGVQEKSCRLLEKPSVIDGHACLVMREGVPGDLQKGLTRSYWLDPARGYRVLRYIGAGPGVPGVQFDIEYEGDDASGWNPSKWSVMCIPTDERDPIQEFATFEMTDLKLNFPIEAATFHAEFPSGSWVIDMDKQVSYIVREDGTQRMILDLEYRAGAEYADLASSEPGGGYESFLARQLSPAPCRHVELYISTFLIFAILVAGTLVYRRRSRRMREAGSQISQETDSKSRSQ